MSLWGATVITNLLSAIPWIGVDFVEFKNTLFNLNFFLIISCLICYFKKYSLIMSNINTIGSVNTKGLRGQKTSSDIDKAYALNIPFSFLSMLMGLIAFLLIYKILINFIGDYSFNLFNLNFNNTSLVVWGSIISSGVGQGKNSKIVQSMYSLTNYQQSVLIGLMLSDAWFNKASNKSVNLRFGFSQSLDKFEYFFNIFKIFCNIITNFPYLRIRKRSGKTTYALEFYTRSLPCLNKYYLLFYKDLIKIIKIELFHYFNPIVLAHWICGDGKYSKSGGLILCTDSFTLNEVILLINILIIKFELDCTIHLNKPGSYRIYIKKSSMNKLQELVSPHFVQSMLYKIHLS